MLPRPPARFWEKPDFKKVVQQGAQGASQTPSAPTAPTASGPEAPPIRLYFDPSTGKFVGIERGAAPPEGFKPILPVPPVGYIAQAPTAEERSQLKGVFPGTAGLAEAGLHVTERGFQFKPEVERQLTGGMTFEEQQTVPYFAAEPKPEPPPLRRFVAPPVVAGRGASELVRVEPSRETQPSTFWVMPEGATEPTPITTVPHARNIFDWLGAGGEFIEGMGTTYPILGAVARTVKSIFGTAWQGAKLVVGVGGRSFSTSSPDAAKQQWAIPSPTEVAQAIRDIWAPTQSAWSLFIHPEERQASMARRYGISEADAQEIRDYYMRVSATPPSEQSAPSDRIIELLGGARQRAIDLRGQAARARSEGHIEEAYQLILEAQRQDRLASFTRFDPTYSYTWEGAPEREQAFDQALAQAELQRGTPLNRWEIDQIKEHFEDPGVELAGQVMFDLFNLPIVGELLGSVFRLGKQGFLTVGREVGGELRRVPGIGSFISWAGKQAVQSAASTWGARFYEVLYNFSRATTKAVGPEGEVSLQDWMRQASTWVQQMNEAMLVADPAERVRLLRESSTQFPKTIFTRQLGIMLDLSKIEGFEPAQWSEFIERASRAVYSAARREKLAEFLAQGLDETEAIRRAEIAAKQLASDPHQVARAAADQFRRVFLRNRVLSSAAYGRAEGVILEGTPMAYLAHAVGAAEGTRRLQVLEAVTSSWNWFRNKWVEYVLARRPAWVVFNYVDSTFRFLLWGGRPQDDIRTILAMYQERGLPALELGQAFGRSDINLGEKVADRMLRGAWWPQAGPFSFVQHEWDRLGHPLGDAWKALLERRLTAKEGFLAPFKEGLNIWRALADGTYDYNGFIEFTLRARLFHSHFTGLFQELNAAEWVRLVDQFGPRASERIRDVMSYLWRRSGRNAAALEEMAKGLLVGGRGAGRVPFSVLLPENVQELLKTLPPDYRDLFLRTVLGQLEDTIRAAKTRAGVTDDVLGRAVDDLRRAFNEEVAARSAVGSGADDVGEVVADLTGQPIPREEPNVRDARGPMPRPGTPRSREVPPSIRTVEDGLERLRPRQFERLRKVDKVAAYRDSLTDVVKVEMVSGGGGVGKVGDDLVFQMPTDYARTHNGREVMQFLEDGTTEAIWVLDEDAIRASKMFKDVNEFKRAVRVFWENPEEMHRTTDRLFNFVMERYLKRPRFMRVMEALRGKTFPLEKFTDLVRPGRLNEAALLAANVPQEEWGYFAKARGSPEYHAMGEAQAAAHSMLGERIRGMDADNPAQRVLAQLSEEVNPLQARLFDFLLNTYPGPLLVNGSARGRLWDLAQLIQARNYQSTARFFDQLNTLADDVLAGLPEHLSLRRFFEDIGGGRIVVENDRIVRLELPRPTGKTSILRRPITIQRFMEAFDIQSVAELDVPYLERAALRNRPLAEMAVEAAPVVANVVPEGGVAQVAQQAAEEGRARVVPAEGGALDVEYQKLNTRLMDPATPKEELPSIRQRMGEIDETLRPSRVKQRAADDVLRSEAERRGFTFNKDFTEKLDENGQMVPVEQDDIDQLEIMRTEVQAAIEAAKEVPRVPADVTTRRLADIPDPLLRASYQTEAQSMAQDVLEGDPGHLIWGKGDYSGSDQHLGDVESTYPEWYGTFSRTDHKKNLPQRTVEALQKLAQGAEPTTVLEKRLHDLIWKNMLMGVPDSVAARPANTYALRAFGKVMEGAQVELAWANAGVAWDDMLRGLRAMADEEAGASARAAWETYIASDDFPPALRGFARSREGFVSYLNGQIEEMVAGGADRTQALRFDAIRRLKWQVEHFYDSVKPTLPEWPDALRASAYQGRLPLPFPTAELPPGIQSLMRHMDDLVGTQETVNRFFDELRTYLISSNQKGRLWVGQLNEEEAALIREFADIASTAKARAFNAAMFGTENVGDYGRAIEGAVPFVGEKMLDYTQYSNLDNIMRVFLPFWMFPSRSIPFWLETMFQNPELAAFYSKYMAYSRRWAYELGGTNADGQQKPSLEGYVPVAGTDLWVNPLAPLSFRYLFLRPTPRYNDLAEDAPLLQRLASEMYEAGIYRGFSPGPWTLLVLYGTGLLDRNQFPANSLLPITELVPPWTQRSILTYVRRMAWPNAPDVWNPQVSWQDYLIETQVLKDALQSMDEPNLSDSRLLWIAANAEAAIKGRSENGQIVRDSPTWLAAQREVEGTQYYQELVGYFTGIFAKPFTDADAEWLRLRDELNFLRDTINDQVGAELFHLLPDPDQRYERFVQERYRAPQGYLHSLWGISRFTRTPEGQTIYGQERRTYMAEQITEEQETRAYYTLLDRISGDRDGALRALPIGASGEARHVIWETYFADRARAETLYPLARRGWVVGYKPITMVEEHFTDLWWQMLRETRPLWHPGTEQFSDFESRLTEWEQTLPNLAEWLAGSFENTIIPAEMGERPEDEVAGKQWDQRRSSVQKLIASLRTQASPETLAAWEKTNDTPMDAANASWRALYWDPYWTAVQDKTGYERQIAEQDFLKQNPTPTMDQIKAWIEANYPGRWTGDEIDVQVGGPDVLSVEQRLAPTTNVAATKDVVWNLLSWAGPGAGRGALEDAFVGLGGDDSFIGSWYDTGGRLAEVMDPGEFQAQVDLLKRAAARVGVQEPSRDQLVEFAVAQETNDYFWKRVAEQWGEDFQLTLARISRMSDLERAQFKADNPTAWEARKAYFQYRDDFAGAFPLWAKYYNPDALTKAGGGTTKRVGGGTSTGAGGRRAGNAPASATVRMGYRSTTTGAELLAPGRLGKGGVGGPPVWPKGLSEAIGPIVSQQIAVGKLSDEARRFLKGLRDRHQEWRSVLDKLLSSTP